MAWWVPLAMAAAAETQRRSSDPGDNSLLAQIGRPFFGGPDRSGEREREFYEQAMQEIQEVPLPDLQELDFANYTYAGDYRPELIDERVLDELARIRPEQMTAAQQGSTAFNDIELDTRLREQQLASLRELTDIGESGGFRDVDEAALNAALTQSGMADRGRREAIANRMNVRGMGGSGMELLANLQSAQDAATRDNQESLNRAGMAQERALRAIMDSGDLAGRMSDVDYNRGAQRATASDRIAQFNAENTNRAREMNMRYGNEFLQRGTDRRYDAARDNARMSNDALHRNQQGRQDISNRNVATANAQQNYNQNQRVQQNFDNRMDRAKARAGAAGGMANYWGNEADRRARGRQNQMGAMLGAGAWAADAWAQKKHYDEVERLMKQRQEGGY